MQEEVGLHGWDLVRRLRKDVGEAAATVDDGLTGLLGLTSVEGVERVPRFHLSSSEKQRRMEEKEERKREGKSVMWWIDQRAAPTHELPTLYSPNCSHIWARPRE